MRRHKSYYSDSKLPSESFLPTTNGSFYSQSVNSLAAKKQISKNRPRPHNYPRAVHKTFVTGRHTGAQLNINSTPDISSIW